MEENMRRNNTYKYAFL